MYPNCSRMLKTSRPRRLDRCGVVVSSPTTQIPYATVDHNPSNANYLVINFSISDTFKLSIAGIAELAGMLARDGHATVSLSEMDQAIVQGAIDGGK